MNSDYIPRLRRELLRAGATQPARWRPAPLARGLRPLAATAAVALVVVAGVLALGDGGADETPVDRTAGALRLSYRVEPPTATQQTADVMRERLAAAGIEDAGVSVASSGGLTIAVPPSARADVAALGQRGRLAIYDWERSVLGPQDAPVSKAEAEARAARRPDARVVRGERGGWFALGGEPAITNAGIERARPSADVPSGDPIVAFDLTRSGQDAFSALTRTLAHRGSAQAAAGPGGEKALQHFAIVLDDRILSTPFIDFRQVPDGLDGARGAQISGGLTPDSARQLAALLSAGPLAADLTLASEAKAGG